MVARLSAPTTPTVRKALVAAVAGASLLLASCSGGVPTDNASSSSENARMIEVEDNYGVQEVPSPPSTLVALDNRSFEVLQQWGIEPAAAPLELVPATIDLGADVLDVGNHREPDLELITAVEPDLIISGQRFTQHDEAIRDLNPGTPLVDFEPREGEAFDAELIRQVEALGEIFGKQDEAEALVSDFNDALNTAGAAYDPEQTVMAVNVSGGNIGYIAPSVGRTFGPLFDILGLTPALEVPEGSANHEGDDISVEAIAQANPDILLVLDRDAAVETGATPAKSVIEGSAALQNVTAVREGNVVYAPADTYTNESIITFTEIFNLLAEQFGAPQ